MSDFRTLLGAFHDGACTAERLLAEVDRQIEGNRVDPVTLLAWLEEAHAAQPLPRQLHDVLSGRILAALEVATPALTARDDSRPFRDPDRSVTLVSKGSIDAAEDVPSVRAEPAVKEGSVLKHRFKLMECIGEGGMGRVYKAIDLRRVEARAPEIHVAVKILTASFSEYAGSLVLLQREATKLQTLPHPNIVRVIDCDRDGQTVFMTMEYLQGRPLKQMLPDTSAPRSAAESLRILTCIADALSFAHANGVVHGDLKPGNVILTDSGEVKVIDFGFARAIANSGHSGAAAVALQETSGTWGALTPSHASPEMLAGDAPDARDDVYALACIAYELLTGTHPFDKQPANVARDLGLRVQRRGSLTRTQFGAIVGGLDLYRERRTATVREFMDGLLGHRAARSQRLLAITAGIVLLLIAGVYWFTRTRGVPLAADPEVGAVFRDCAECPLMRVLPAGGFEQGAAADELDALPFEQPRHRTTISRSIAFGVEEVTRAEFAAFVEATAPRPAGCTSYDGAWADRSELSWQNVGYPQGPSHPVTCVSWQDATAYAQWLSEKAGHPYRLPSASEWEYAARAGADAQRPWGAQLADACGSANVADESALGKYPGWEIHPCSDGYVYTAPVGAFTANAFGLNDMLGNVFEWVQDCWHENYRGAPADGTPWIESGCEEREMRGGSWFTTPEFVRAAYRNHFDAAARSNTFGFRVVREIGQ